MNKSSWTPIDGYEELYEISDEGEVWSCRNKIILKPRINNRGYCRVRLVKDGVGKEFLVSRLVALAFIPNDDPINKTQVNHIIEDQKTNNCVENLEWITPKENVNYGTRNKRQSNSMTGIKKSEEHKKQISESKKGMNCGERHSSWGKKRSEEVKEKMSKSHIGKKHTYETKCKMGRPVICITTGNIYYSTLEAERQTGISNSSINKCCIGKYKSAGKSIDGTKLIWKFYTEE